MGGTAAGAFISVGILLLGASMAAAQDPAAAQGLGSYWKFDEASGTTSANSVAAAPADPFSATGITISNNLPSLVSYKNDPSLRFNGTSSPPRRTRAGRTSAGLKGV